jgi:hypothetical protein
MIMIVSAVALAAAQPAVQTSPAAPSAHSEAMTHQGRHCCCCADMNREGCAEHMHHGAEHSGHEGH